MGTVSIRPFERGDAAAIARLSTTEPPRKIGAGPGNNDRPTFVDPYEQS